MVRLIEDGSKLVVTAPGTVVGSDTVGAFYVYVNTGDGYNGRDTYEYWKGPYYGPVADEKFGWSLALAEDGDRIFVGAPAANSGDGKVYLYNYAKDTGEYVLQGDYVDEANGLGGGLGQSLFYDAPRNKLYAGAPNYGSFFTYTDLGRVAVFDVPTAPTVAPTAAPTPPTPSPTAAPTPSPYITVGVANIKYNVVGGTARSNVAQDTITDVTSKFARPSDLSFRVKSTETSTTTKTVYDDFANKTLFEEAYTKARGCYPDCTATVTDTGDRRLSGRSLQSSGSIVVEIVFDLTAAAYNALVASGNNLDDPGVITDLATELGVGAGNITVTVTDGEVTVEVTLTATVTENPSGAETLDDIVEIQASLNNATTILVDEFGGPQDSVTTVTLDLCSGRDCTGRGDATAPDTDANGCNVNTGQCVCDGDWWGINCETACECNNGGACVSALCHCVYPYFGLRCDDTADCTC
jgi:hypothetical protein